MRPLFALAAYMMALSPVGAAAQSPDPSANPAKLTPGVAPCATYQQLKQLSPRSVIPRPRGNGCARILSLIIRSRSDWHAVKPFIRTQRQLHSFTLDNLDVETMDQILNAIPDPTTVRHVQLIGDSNGEFSKLPTGLSRFGTLPGIVIKHWNGNNFPDVWKLGLSPKQYGVRSRTSLQLPDSILDQSNLESMRLDWPVSDVAKRATTLPGASISAPMLAGLPRRVCETKYTGFGAVVLVRPGKTNLSITGSLISKICEPIARPQQNAP